METEHKKVYPTIEVQSLEIMSSESLPQQLEEEKSTSVKGRRPLASDECESSFTQAVNLKRHELSVHPGITEFKCSTCDYMLLPLNQI